MKFGSVAAFFITIQLLFGFNFGFSAMFNKRIEVLLTLISTATSSIICLIIIIPNYLLGGHNLNTTDYIFVCVFLHFSKNAVYIFFQDLLAIDKQIKLTVSDGHVGAVMFVYTFFIFAVKYGVTAAHCVKKEENALEECLLPNLVYCIDDVLPVVNALIYYKVYQKLKFLKTNFKEPTYPLKHAQNIFKDICDCFDKLRSRYDPVIVTVFVFSTIKMITIVYYHVSMLKMQKSWSFIILSSLWPVHHVVQVILPAVAAELIDVQIEGMARILHERLLTEQDAEEKAQLLSFVGYLESRRPLRAAGRLVPLGLRAILAVFGISSTYVIVIIQFRHLLD